MGRGKAKARILAFPTVAIGAVLVLSSSLALLAFFGHPFGQAQTPSECPPVRCPGLAYEILYSQKDGKIIAMGAWDASLPGAPRPGDSYSPRQGEAVLVIPTNEYARRIMDNPDAYFVNVSTRTVQPRPASPVATPVAQQQ